MPTLPTTLKVPHVIAFNQQTARFLLLSRAAYEADASHYGAVHAVKTYTKHASHAVAYDRSRTRWTITERTFGLNALPF